MTLEEYRPKVIEAIDTYVLNSGVTFSPDTADIVTVTLSNPPNGEDATFDLIVPHSILIRGRSREWLITLIKGDFQKEPNE